MPTEGNALYGSNSQILDLTEKLCQRQNLLNLRNIGDEEKKIADKRSLPLTAIIP